MPEGRVGGFVGVRVLGAVVGDGEAGGPAAVGDDVAAGDGEEEAFEGRRDVDGERVPAGDGEARRAVLGEGAGFVLRVGIQKALLVQNALKVRLPLTMELAWRAMDLTMRLLLCYF